MEDQASFYTLAVNGKGKREDKKHSKESGFFVVVSFSWLLLLLLLGSPLQEVIRKDTSHC